MSETGHAPNRSGEVGQEAGNALTLAARFASQDKTRPILTAVLWRGGETEDQIVATDTYRLFGRKVERTKTGIKPEPGEDWLIPAEAIVKVTGAKGVRRDPQIALRCPCPVKLEEGKQPEFDSRAEDSPHHIGVQAQARDHSRRCKLRVAVAETVTGIFPNIDKVIPDYNEDPEELSWEALVKAVDLNTALPHLYDVEDCHRVNAEFGAKRLFLQAVDGDPHSQVAVEARAEAPAEVLHRQKPPVAAYDGHLLADLTTLLVEESSLYDLRFQVNGHALSALRIDGPWGVYMLMPMRPY